MSYKITRFIYSKSMALIKKFGGKFSSAVAVQWK